MSDDKPQIETDNEKIVSDFCAAWSNRDAEALTEFMHEDIVYQIAEGQPLINGTEAFKQAMTAFLQNLETVEWETLRQHSIGDIVINERIDRFLAPEGGKSPTMVFRIAGYFWIKDGKIKEWKDWAIPGAEQIVG